MSRFFVGQRVRILWSDNWPELAGEEGRIISVGAVIGCGMGAGRIGVHVAPDMWRSEFAPRVGNYLGLRFCPEPRQLEPILPEGHAPAELSVEELLPFLREREAA